MSKYDYREAVCEDIRQCLNYRGMSAVTADNRDEVYEELYDELWIEDSVTGNASGSYTFSTWKAEENLCHNMDLLQEACAEFCCEPNLDSAEWCDVTIRCYLLGECLSAVLDECVEEFEQEVSNANSWWDNAGFGLMERVTGIRPIDFEDSDEFVDECENYWNDLDDEDKVSKYHEHR